MYNLKVEYSKKGGVKDLCYFNNWKILTAFLIACRAGVNLVRAQYFISEKLRSPPLILIASEGWGEREICIKGVCDGQN